MEINIKDNIYIKTFEKKVSLNEEIVNLILSNKLDKVLFKGEPNEINFKLLRKILPSCEKNVEPEIVRKKYRNIIEICDNPLCCMIYKK